MLLTAANVAPTEPVVDVRELDTELILLVAFLSCPVTPETESAALIEEPNVLEAPFAAPNSDPPTPAPMLAPVFIKLLAPAKRDDFVLGTVLAVVAAAAAVALLICVKF